MNMLRSLSAVFPHALASEEDVLRLPRLLTPAKDFIADTVHTTALRECFHYRLSEWKFDPDDAAGVPRVPWPGEPLWLEGPLRLAIGARCLLVQTLATWQHMSDPHDALPQIAACCGSIALSLAADGFLVADDNDVSALVVGGASYGEVLASLKRNGLTQVNLCQRVKDLKAALARRKRQGVYLVHELRTRDEELALRVQTAIQALELAIPSFKRYGELRAYEHKTKILDELNKGAIATALATARQFPGFDSMTCSDEESVEVGVRLGHLHGAVRSTLDTLSYQFRFGATYPLLDVALSTELSPREITLSKQWRSFVGEVKRIEDHRVMKESRFSCVPPGFVANGGEAFSIDDPDGPFSLRLARGDVSAFLWPVDNGAWFVRPWMLRFDHKPARNRQFQSPTDGLDFLERHWRRISFARSIWRKKGWSDKPERDYGGSPETPMLT